MSQLHQVPPVGINSDFISEKPRTLIVQGKVFSKKSTVTLDDGSPMFHIQPESFSASHRIHLLDARSDQEIFQLQKRSLRSKYYASQSGDESQSLVDLEIQSALFGGPTTIATFGNTANGGAPAVFEYKVHTMENINTVMWDGHPVAEIEKKSMSMSGQFMIRLAPGVDPLPVLTIVMALADRARSRNNASAGAAGGAAGGGGGC